MHRYGIITLLPFSKYANPIFAQPKPYGKLRLIVDLMKINTLIAHDCTNNNHPVSILSGAAEHLAGKSIFCKLDCSQLEMNTVILQVDKHLKMRTTLGKLHVYSWNLHTKYSLEIGKHYTIKTTDANTDTF